MTNEERIKQASDRCIERIMTDTERDHYMNDTVCAYCFSEAINDAVTDSPIVTAATKAMEALDDSQQYMDDHVVHAMESLRQALDPEYRTPTAPAPPPDKCPRCKQPKTCSCDTCRHCRRNRRHLKENQ